MSLVDGTISGAGTTSGIDRTITNYVLMRQMEEGGKEGEHAFIFTGSTSSSINGQSVSKTVSAIVYPTTFSDDNIDVEITLTEDGKATVYPVALPGNEWLAGTNCIYTFSAGRNKLTVVEVSVEDWEEDPQAEIPL